jgi:hypothetical protein
MKRFISYVIILTLLGCTAVVIPRNSTDNVNTKITLEQNNTLVQSDCPIYIPIDRMTIPTLDSRIDDIDKLDTDPDLAIELLLNYIRERDNVDREYRLKSDQHYLEYLKLCHR